MNCTQILARLDKHAAEFNFPVLDNAYIEFAGARLSAFLSRENWLLIFEIIGFSNREVEFVNNIYAYGSCVEREGLIGEEIMLSSTGDRPLFDHETRECIADWSRWSVTLGNEIVSLSPTREEYARAGVTIDGPPGPGTLREVDLLRFLLYRFPRERFFLPDEVLLRNFPRCKGIPKFIQTSSWQHPDVGGDEKPSENISLRTLVEALSQDDPKVFQPGVPNTDWRAWA